MTIKSISSAVAAIALATSVPLVYGQTTVGGATLIDTATVHSGTVAPTSFLSYVSGGNGLQGFATGSTWGGTGDTQATALATADHIWAQYDPAIIFYSSVAISAVIAVPALDHGWTPDNSGEFWEPFEFKIYGCSVTGGCTDAGVITDVWTKGVDDTGAYKNADDWTTRWSFSSAHNYFAVVSGDRLVGGCYSCGEGEIDALGVAAIPEPETYAMLLAGLGLLGFAARRRKLKLAA